MNAPLERKKKNGLIEDSLSIEVTTQCNFECSHCFARAGYAKPASLSLNIVKEICTEGYEIGYRRLHITGGEPLLWNNLFAALDFAYSTGYQSVFLNTNGALLTTAIANRLADYDGMAMSVSLEGSEVLHKKLRGEGAYRQVMQGIERALDAGLPLSIFTLACRSLQSKLFEFTESLYRKFPNIDRLTLIQLVPINDGYFKLSDELLEPEDLIKLIRLAGALNLFGYRTQFLNNPLVNVASKQLNLLWVSTSKPLYSADSIIIMANRDVCLSHSNRYRFGKYGSGMIQKVLASDDYRRKIAPNENICSSCQWGALCLESGMERPSESYWDIKSDRHYCQTVLDSIQARRHDDLQDLLVTVR